MINIKSKKAQHLLEYAIILAIVSFGFLAMATYIKRASQGSLRGAIDRAFGSHYNPGCSTILFTTNTSANEVIKSDGIWQNTYLGWEGEGSPEVKIRYGYEETTYFQPPQ